MKRLLCLVLTLTAAVGLMLVRDSAAWLVTSSGTALGQTIDVKKLNFTFQGGIGSYLQYDPQDEHSFFIITDTNLIQSGTGKLSGTNFSTIPTELRFKVTYTSPNGGGTVTYSGSGDLLSVTAASGWTLNSTDHYFYYSANSGKMPANTAQGGTSFDLLTDISFSEATMQSAMSTAQHTATTGDLTQSGTIVVDIQARQSDNMIWADLDTIISGS